jgi:uracil-DNA glycosylase family 4
MTLDRGLLARYFRQHTDLGVDELYLADLTSAEALALLAGRDATDTRAPLSLRVHVSQQQPSAAAVTTVVAPIAVSSSAVTAARALHVLSEHASGCVRCRLHESRTNVVFGEGSATADVVVVGEAPGQEEDRSGRPFVGRAGKLLDLLLMSAGFPRDTVYICNVLKCRPPENRNPLPDEVAACASHLHGQLEAIAPKVLLAVGKFSAQLLAGSEDSIGRLRGRIHAYRGTPLIVTYHPAYLLRSPQMTRVAWQDFQLLRTVLDDQA